VFVSDDATNEVVISEEVKKMGKPVIQEGN
jgi:hypothetical protein